MKRKPFLITALIVFFLLGCQLTSPRAVTAPPTPFAMPAVPAANDSHLAGSALAQGNMVFLHRLQDVKGECIVGECAPGPSILGPTYSWDDPNHRLEIYQPGYGVDYNAKMLFGDGKTLYGIAGGGYSSSLSQVYDAPATLAADITLMRIEEDGTLYLTMRDEDIMLRSGQTFCTAYSEVTIQGQGQIQLNTTDCLTNFGVISKEDLVMH